MVNPESNAKKFDQDKARIDLVPADALLKVAEIFTFGAKKYDAENWRHGEGLEWGRLYSASQRHLAAWLLGEDFDGESGLPHLAHAATNLFMLLHYTGHPDRYLKDTRFMLPIDKSPPDTQNIAP